MTSQFDPINSGQAGFTLFETLISLTILSLVMAVSVTAMRGPSPTIRLQQMATDVQRDATKSRDRAIRFRLNVPMEIGELSCDDNSKVTWFYPDGTATGPDVCLAQESVSLRLRLDVMPGQYLNEAEP